MRTPFRSSSAGSSSRPSRRPVTTVTSKSSASASHSWESRWAVASTLVDLHEKPSRRTSVATVDGARVHYLATPLHYRWMGITPTLPWWLAKLPKPDVVHIYGFRDPVTTVTAAWCRRRRIPYVF